MTFLFEMLDLRWQDGAACAAPGVDKTLFFPRTEGRPSKEWKPEIVAAKAICASCPIKEACLEHAMTNKERWGIWGGLTETERKKLFAEQEHRKHTPGPALAPFCGRGHDLRKPENIIQLLDGGRRCRICHVSANKGLHTKLTRSLARGTRASA